MDVNVTIDLTRIANDLGISQSQVESVVALLDDGNTIPFITRYRKERTGNLDEEQLRTIQEKVVSLRQLGERSQTILRLIEAQGKLTAALRARIEAADSLKRLEDLYLPFRPRKRSRASAARERGLEPLADQIWSGSLTPPLAEAAQPYVNADNELAGTEDVLQGAGDILAERIGDDANVRDAARKLVWQTGKFVVTVADRTSEAAQAYRDYFDYKESVTKVPPHRTLALNRGEKAGILKIRFETDEPRTFAAIQQRLPLERHPFAEFLKTSAQDALHRLILPSLEREVRREQTEKAEAHAVAVFARNLRNLLLQPPVQGKRILAIDPGFRTGCKLAVLDEIGNCLANDVVFTTGSAEKRESSKSKLAALLDQYQCRLVAIGNGTACRETEELISELIAEQLPDLAYVIVNEAGASIYSASPLAREEFPDYDATVRGTISIGRRLQDPLSELVKIDAQHIGVGMYQHDVSPKELKESLGQVIESCVNFVGVDLNTASPALLSHVSGLNQLTARRVVEWRNQHGRFSTRAQLHKVSGIGESTFTQAAGFLKISGGDEPLDQTWIHPESYPLARRVLERLSLSPDSLRNPSSIQPPLRERLATLDAPQIAGELEAGLPTLLDIFDALARPGRDPRADLPGHIFKQGVLKLEDLQPGMELQGTVLNVVDFGVFVDVGLKDSGLVHISQMATQFVRSPHEVAAVGDIVTVWVMGVDLGRRRVSLTMVNPAGRSSTSVAATPPPSSGGKAPSKPAGDEQKSKLKPVRKTESKSLPPLTPDRVAGQTPLRGFDELKQLWKKRDD